MAWRSARTTTKNCDYVLAVMPDIKGYTVPQKARSYSFEILIADAFGQLISVGLDVISKVPKGMIEHKSGGPWINKIPSNVTEVFDTFLVVPTANTDKLVKGRSAVHFVDHCKTSEKIDFGRDKFVELWESAGNFEYQISSLPLNGPCVGYTRGFRTPAAKRSDLRAQPICVECTK
jgi:hypothetical protein